MRAVARSYRVKYTTTLRKETLMVNAQPNNQRLLDHMEYVARGSYLLPEFQRTFVWDDEKVRYLWDSLYNGFPVGQLMLWVPDNKTDFPMRSMGSVIPSFP